MAGSKGFGMVGTVPRTYGVFITRNCEWRGCKKAAFTTGKISKSKIGNVCAKHKGEGDRRYK